MKAVRMYVNAPASILFAPDRNEVPGPNPPSLTNPDRPILVEHQRAIHPRLARKLPASRVTDVCGEIARREEALREDAVGRRRNERRVGSRRERRSSKGGWCERRGRHAGMSAIAGSRTSDAAPKIRK
jgi:hypothetical protein